jgi:hypothetical protein
MALRRLSYFLLAALFLAGCNKPADGGSTVSGSTPAQAPTEATLRLKASKGDKFTMVMEMDTQIQMPDPAGGTPQTHSMKMSVTKEHTCIDVTDGKMKWEEKTIDSSGTGTGPFEAQVKQMVEAEKKKAPTTEVLDERNKVVESTENDPFSLVYPEKPVKVGDTWEADSKMFDQDVKVTFKLDRFEKVGGKDAAVISASVSGNDKLKMIKPLVVFVDTANGWPMKGDGEFEMEAAPGIKAKLIAKISVK